MEIESTADDVLPLAQLHVAAKGSAECVLQLAAQVADMQAQLEKLQMSNRELDHPRDPSFCDDYTMQNNELLQLHTGRPVNHNIHGLL